MGFTPVHTRRPLDPHPTPGLTSNCIDECRSLDDDYNYPKSLRSDGDQHHPGTAIAIRVESLIGFPGIRTAAKAKQPSPRQAAMVLARRTEKLTPDEQQQLAKWNECCPGMPIRYELTQGFAAVFRGKQSDALQNWLVEANREGLPEISRFCDGLLRDAKTDTAAVNLPWSNG